MSNSSTSTENVAASRDSAPEVAQSSKIQADEEGTLESDGVAEGQGSESFTNQNSSISEKDCFLVDFDENDAYNSRAWPKAKRWSMTMCVAMITFLSPMVSSVAAPVAPVIGKDFHMTSSVSIVMIMSIYVLAYAIGPFIFSPLSEMYGRKIVFVSCNILFLAFNIGCGFSTSGPMITGFRFVTGLGGSAPLSVSGGIMSDIWTPDERARAMAIYSLGPLLGPAIGPIIAGFIGEYSTWRWCFWSTSICNGVFLCALIFYFQETYAPFLLRKKAAQIRKKTGDDRYYSMYDQTGQKVHRLVENLVRPIRMISTQFVIQFLAIYMAFLYGLMYLNLSSFSRLWVERYNMRLDMAGLQYISMCIGFMLGAQLGLRLQDRFRNILKKRNGGVSKPEFRIPPMFIGGPLLTIGLLWYGWSAQAKVFWIMPDIGMILTSAGIILSYMGIQLYLVDTYGMYAASSIAAASTVRSLCGFGFPLFSTAMFDKLGYGWGNSVLALISLVLYPLSFIFWRYGERFRARSPYCAEAS